MQTSLICKQVEIARTISASSGIGLSYDEIDRYDYYTVVDSSPFEVKYANALLDTIKYYEKYKNKLMLLPDILAETHRINNMLTNRIYGRDSTVLGAFDEETMAELADILSVNEYIDAIDKALLIMYYIIKYSNYHEFVIETAIIAANVISYAGAGFVLFVDENNLNSFLKELIKYTNGNNYIKFIKRIARFLGE